MVAVDKRGPVIFRDTLFRTGFMQGKQGENGAFRGCRRVLILAVIGVCDRHINMSIAINLNRHEPLSSEIDVRGTQK